MPLDFNLNILLDKFKKENNSKIIEKLNIALNQFLNEKNLVSIIEDKHINFLFNSKKVSGENKYLLFNHLIDNKDNYLKTIKEIFNLNFEVLDDRIEFNFPVLLSNNSAKIVNASVVPIKEKKVIDIFDAFPTKDGLNTVLDITKQGFIIAVDTPNIYKTSYMLSLIIALKLKWFPKRITFTGNISENGSILNVDGIDLKQKVVKEDNKILLHPGMPLMKHIDNVLEFVKGNIPVVIPFYVNISVDNSLLPQSLIDLTAKYAADKGFAFPFSMDIFNSKDLTFFSGRYLPEDDNEESRNVWLNTLSSVKKRLDSIKGFFNSLNFLKTPDIKIILALRTPVAFAAMLGNKNKTLIGVSALAYYDNKVSKYTEIISLSQNKELNVELIEKPETLTLTSKNIAIALKFVSEDSKDKVKIAVKAMAKKNNYDYSLISLKHYNNDEIPVNLFNSISKKVAEILNNLVFSGKEVHLLIASSTVLGFLIGKDIGRTAIQLYHFRGNSYLKVKTLSK